MKIEEYQNKILKETKKFKVIKLYTANGSPAFLSVNNSININRFILWWDIKTDIETEIRIPHPGWELLNKGFLDELGINYED